VQHISLTPDKQMNSLTTQIAYLCHHIQELQAFKNDP